MERTFESVLDERINTINRTLGYCEGKLSGLQLARNHGKLMFVKEFEITMNNKTKLEAELVVYTKLKTDIIDKVKLINYVRCSDYNDSRKHEIITNHTNDIAKLVGEFNLPGYFI
jgi:hypothetical protein